MAPSMREKSCENVEGGKKALKVLLSPAQYRGEERKDIKVARQPPINQVQGMNGVKKLSRGERTRKTQSQSWTKKKSKTTSFEKKKSWVNWRGQYSVPK